MTIENERVRGHLFLAEMREDAFYPDFLVAKGVEILRELCAAIEENRPKTLSDLYHLTHAATEKFNELEQAFFDNGSEIETVARDNIGADFGFIAASYGFEADAEELIAPREW